MTPFTPEFELNLQCARTRLDAGAAERIRELAGDSLDWRAASLIAESHGTLPFLYRGLRDAGNAPDAVLRGLEDSAKAIARRNLGLAAELLRILSLLEAHGIPAIPFKGPVLAVMAYDDLGVRDFCDLDVLVRKRDVLRARDVLIANGFRLPAGMTGADEAVYLHSHHHYPSLTSDSGVYVEIHWAFARPCFGFPFDYEALWDRLQRVRVGGAEVCTLGPKDLLLILCVHGANHRWKRLEWICAVAELIGRNPDLDWVRVLAESRRLHVARMLMLGVHLAANLMAAPAPESIIAIARSDPAVEKLAAGVGNRHLFEHERPATVREKMAFDLLTIDRSRDRARYLIRNMIDPDVNDSAALRLPSALFNAYYLIRPFRIAGSVLRGSARRMSPWMKRQQIW